MCCTFAVDSCHTLPHSRYADESGLGVILIYKPLYESNCAGANEAFQLKQKSTAHATRQVDVYSR